MRNIKRVWRRIQFHQICPLLLPEIREKSQTAHDQAPRKLIAIETAKPYWVAKIRNQPSGQEMVGIDINPAHRQSSARRYHRRIALSSGSSLPASEIRKAHGCLQWQLHNFQGVIFTSWFRSREIYDYGSPKLFEIYSIAMDNLATGEIIQALTKNKVATDDSAL